MIMNTKLKICYFSTYRLLIDRMNEILKAESKHNFQHYHDLKGFSIMMGDIFIFDAAMDLQEIAIIVSKKKKHRVSILVGEIAEITLLFTPQLETNKPMV